MWPFAEGEHFLENQWYVAAWSSEVTADKPFERWICGEPVVFYRDTQGKAVAMHGRCPHRSFPLGKGRVRGDVLECGYHGFQYGPDGNCVRIPSQDIIPDVCRVQTYALVEKWEWLWIWIGDQTRADPGLIPDHDEIRLTEPGWLALPALTNTLNCRAQLLHENLTDISHLSYLHPGTIGTDAVASTRVEISEHDGFLRGMRMIPNEKLTGFFKDALGTEGPLDREVLIDFYPPNLHVAREKFIGSGGNAIAQYRVCHAVTPATATSTNYLVAWSRTFAHDSQGVTDTVNSVFAAVIDEDIDAVEAVENMLARQQQPREVLVSADTHSMRARRIMKKLFAEQSAGAVSGTA